MRASTRKLLGAALQALATDLLLLGLVWLLAVRIAERSGG